MSDDDRSDELKATMHELHNRIAPEVSLRIVNEVRKAGGDESDMVVVLTSVVTAVMSAIKKAGLNEDAVLGIIFKDAKKRLEAVTRPPRDGKHRKETPLLFR